MINTIDLFAGCGGLTEGFKQVDGYNTIACVEWDKIPYNTLLNRFKKKWKHSDAEKYILRFDIQRTKEMIKGWNDKEYGISSGLVFCPKHIPISYFAIMYINVEENTVIYTLLSILPCTFAIISENLKKMHFVVCIIRNTRCSC